MRSRSMLKLTSYVSDVRPACDSRQQEFRQHLSHVQNELRQLERDAARQATQGKRPKKDDFQI